MLAPPASTFSIVAHDAESGSFGVAVQSRYFNVGAGVPWAEAEVGAVASQAFLDPGYGPRALAMMRKGASAAGALEVLLADDPQRELRQVAIVDGSGEAAAHTGALCVPFAGHRAECGRSVQGNLLASPRVWPVMDHAFVRSSDPFPVRLVLALEAGQRAGGDVRGMQSAALLVVSPLSAEEPWRNRVVDLRVEDHPEPIAELRRLLRLRFARDCLARAEQAMLAGRIEEGRQAFEDGLEASRHHDEFLFWGGLGLVLAGDLDGAVANLRAAIRKNPRWREVLPRLPPGFKPPDALLQEALREEKEARQKAPRRRARK